MTILITRAKTEIAIFATAFIGAGLILVFGILAKEVTDDETSAFDRYLLLLFRKSGNLAEPVGPAWFLEMARDVTALGSYALLCIVVLASVGFLLLSKRNVAAFFIVGAVLGGLLLSNGLKVGFARPRPDIVPQLAHVFTASFPSGHATLSAVVYLTLGSLLTRLEDSGRTKFYFLGLAIFLNFIVGLSRIYLGVHFPTDVVAGWCIGAGWAMICWSIALYMQRHGKLDLPQSPPAPTADELVPSSLKKNGQLPEHSK